jgi:4a-hydroxytetrahydrobiopterin dehydratase
MNSPTLRPQALSATAVVTQLTQLNGNAAIGWRLIDGALEKRFVFPNFHETMAFANAVAWIAHHEDHHPELALNHGHGTVRWRTYDVGGITSLDFACAAAVDALLATPRPHP